MDKQLINLKLLPNGDIQFKTSRKETPRNRVISLNLDYIEILVNKKYLVTLDTEEYFAHSLWAHRLNMDHADIRTGVIAFDTGFAHKSVPALIMGTTKGQRVWYRDRNKFNLCKENLFIHEPDPDEEDLDWDESED